MPPRYTYEDYKRFEGDWELIEGFLYAMAPSPFGIHQKIMANLIYLFKEELDECECDIYPELDYIVSENTVLRPDLAVYCEEIEKYPKTTPKIVIEIVSSSTVDRDEKIKFSIYEKEKVDYYVLVYPDFKKVKIYKNKDKFDKVYEGDGKFKFELCDIEIDFKRAFR
jgi:Uma2 family endonuclease